MEWLKPDVKEVSSLHGGALIINGSYNFIWCKSYSLNISIMGTSIVINSMERSGRKTKQC